MSKKISYKDQRLTKAQQKKSKAIISAGIKNYIGEQENVTVPKKWLSSPDHVVAELAYITPREQKILLDADLYGSLNGEPNRGPGGIMSLQGAGDGGGVESDGKGGHTGTGGGNLAADDKGPGRQGDFRSNAQHTGLKGDYSKDRSVTGDISAFDFNNKTQKYELSKKAKDQQAVNDYVQGKMGFQGGKKPSFFGSPGSLKQRNQIYNKQRALNWASKQRARKIKGIDDLIAETYVANPHMDIAEIREALMAQYDSTNKTMTGLESFNTGKLGMNYGPTQLGPLGLNTKNIKGETMSTNYLSTTPSLDSRLSGPGLLGFAVDKLQGPVNVNNLMSSIDRIGQIDTMVDKGITQTDINDYYDKSMGRGKYDIFGGGSTGGGQQPFIPIMSKYKAGAAEEEDPYTNDYTYRMGDEQKVGADVLRGYRADGGIMGTRARKAFGGIMDRVTGRKAYGLGSIFKGVKNAVSGVVDATKKVLKSDVGKMALLYAGGSYLGGTQMFGGTGNLSFMERLASPSNFKNLFMNSDKGILSRVKGLKDSYDGMGKFKKALTMGGLGLGLSMIPGLNKVKPNETSFSDRGGSLKNSQGVEGNAAIRDEIQEAYADGDPVRIAQLQKYYNYMLPVQGAVQDLGLPSSARKLPYEEFGEAGYRTTVATGGRIGRAEGGLMDLGGMEKDYRNDGGFVPIGEYEKKDDVPARLSVNEFVMTADAVRGAGQGDIDKGAEVMENMMKNLENGGTVSEESQGNTGAQDMFSVSQRLGEVI